MNLKMKKNLGFSMIPFAFLFLFDPYYTLFDPLPDFIGYIILITALSNLADVNYHIGDAKRGFKKGIGVSILRFISIYILKHLFAADEQSVGTLLFIFVLSFFELIVIIPAYKDLFDGLLALGMMHEGNCVYYKSIRKRLEINKQTGEKTLFVRESKSNVTEKMYRLTVILLCVRALAVSLPEFTSLTNNQSYEFVNLLRGFGYILTLPIGILWLVRIIRYFISVKRDSLFIHNMSKLYVSEISQRSHIFVARDVTSILYILLSAFVVSFNFFVEYINVVPNYIFYIIILSSVFLVKKYSKLWIPLIACSSAGIVISELTRHFANLLYVDTNFSPIAIKKDLSIYLSYYRVVSFTILDSIWMLAVSILIVFLMWSLFKKHTNYAVALDNRAIAEIKDLKKRFSLGAGHVIGSAILSAFGNIYYVMMQPYENNGIWYIYYSPVISIALSIISTLMFVYFIMFTVNCVNYRYKTDM